MEENDNNINYLESQIGDNDFPKNTVKPAKVTITSVTIKTTNAEGKKMSSPLVEFHVKHPDKPELIKITKIKYLDGENLKASGFWIQTDEDGKFFKGSTIDIILKKLGCEVLKDTYGKEIDTVEESKDNSYLCLKAY